MEKRQEEVEKREVEGRWLIWRGSVDEGERAVDAMENIINAGIQYTAHTGYERKNKSTCMYTNEKEMIICET